MRPISLPQALLLAAFVAAASSAHAQSAPPISAPVSGVGSDTAGKDETAIAKETENPIADLISVPFNNYATFNDRNRGTLDVLEIQPVIPIHLNPDWNLITRTVIPFASWSGVFPSTGTGLGDVVQSFFLSPARPTPSGVVWGAGPVFLYPTATNSFFASRQWGAGPTGAIMLLNGPWTYGLLANHIWSLTDVPSPTSGAAVLPTVTTEAEETEEMIAEGPTTPGRWRINTTFLQPVVSYTFATQTTVFLSSESTYNWTTRQWTVPINAGVNQLVRLGGQTIQIGGLIRYYAERPTGGPNWGMQFRATWVLPTGR